MSPAPRWLTSIHPSRSPAFHSLSWNNTSHPSDSLYYWAILIFLDMHMCTAFINKKVLWQCPLHASSYQFFFIFSHITQHSIQNIAKQNRHILNISKSSQKGGREGRTTKTQKSLLHTITYIKQKTLPSINGRRPGPTNSLYMLLMVYKINILNLHILLVIKGLLAKVVTSKIYIFQDFR